MTIDEALKVAEEACRALVGNWSSWASGEYEQDIADIKQIEDAAVALALLREVLRTTITAQSGTGLYDQLEAILARLEEGEGT